MITEYLNSMVDDDHPWTSKPDSEENILKDMARYTLDPDFEKYGDFVNPNPQWLYKGDAEKYCGCTFIFGNFLAYSHAFRLVTDDAALIARIQAAVDRNKATPEYRAAKEALIKREHEEKERRELLIKKYGNYLLHSL